MIVRSGPLTVQLPEANYDCLRPENRSCLVGCVLQLRAMKKIRKVITIANSIAATPASLFRIRVKAVISS